MRKINWLLLGLFVATLGAAPLPAAAEDVPDSGIATMPEREKDLIAILMDARKEYQTGHSSDPAKDARMGMQLRVISFMRQSQLAEKWVGTVKSRGITDEGEAWIVIEIADGITVGTWTTKRDDLQADSLIRPHTPLFPVVQQAKLGSTVIFDATILKSVLAADDEMVLRPQFIARFSAVKNSQ